MSHLLRRPWVEAALVALPLVVLYQLLSWRHVEAEIGLADNHYFGAAPALYTAIFTEITSGPRRWMHPLLPIVVGLPGKVLVAMGLPVRPVACALVQLATFGMLVVWQLILRNAGCGFWLRALGAWLLGLSFSTILHGALPESFAFGALALLGTIYWLQKGGRSGVVAVLLAAACFGTTVTNLGAWAGMVVAAIWLERRGSVWRSAAFGAVGLLLAIGAFALYETIFGGWDRMEVNTDFEKVWWNWPTDPVARLCNLGDVILAPPVWMQPQCFIAPLVFEPATVYGKGGMTVLLVEAERDARSCWPAVVAYASLLLACSSRVVRDARAQVLALLLLANLLCQLPVYFLYGDALHAYSMHWTFALCGGIVLVARRFGRWGTFGLLALVVGIGVANVRCAFAVADAHLAYRDQRWRLVPTAAGAGEATKPGAPFEVQGQVGLDSGTARPFLLWPDERTSVLPDAAQRWDRLPPFVLPKDQWRWLGEGTVQDDEVTARGRLPEQATVGPAWISLRLDGRWRGYRVEGFLFPQRLGR